MTGNALASAYREGWKACLRGEDGRYTNPHGIGECRDAWDHGFLDAMDSEQGEQPDAIAAGYGKDS